MKLLIITQKVDRNDPILGFFHRWIIEFAKHFESITVICLFEGEHNLPANVKVLSLGKEEGGSRVSKTLRYIVRFYKYIWNERDNYDAVFVHMNQEYVLLGAPLWKLLKKKVTMWRNHHAGSILTRIAVLCSDKVFCTSKYSFTAQFEKTVIMPVGVDTDLFKHDESISRIPHSILFLGRISPVKRPDILIDAIALLKKKNILVEAYLYGDPVPQDKEYFESLKQKARKLGVAESIHFYPGIPNEKTPAIYNQCEIFMNGSPSGMYDKTIFEAMACESLVLSSNRNLRGQIDNLFLFEEGNVKEFSEKLEYLLNLPTEEKKQYGRILRSYVTKRHGLALLSTKLLGYLHN